MVSKPYYRVDLFNRQMTDVLLTSLLVTTIDNKTVAHIGTSTGRLLQVRLGLFNSPRLRYESPLIIQCVDVGSLFSQDRAPLSLPTTLSWRTRGSHPSPPFTHQSIFSLWLETRYSNRGVSLNKRQSMMVVLEDTERGRSSWSQLSSNKLILSENITKSVLSCVLPSACMWCVPCELHNQLLSKGNLYI